MNCSGVRKYRFAFCEKHQEGSVIARLIYKFRETDAPRKPISPLQSVIYSENKLQVANSIIFHYA